MNDNILLTIPSGPRFRAVASLVLGGVGARLELPYEQIEDLQLALASTLESADRDGTVSIEIRAETTQVTIAVGPLERGSTEDAGLMRVLKPLADAVRTSTRDGSEWIELDVVYAAEYGSAAPSP